MSEVFPMLCPTCGGIPTDSGEMKTMSELVEQTTRQRDSALARLSACEKERDEARAGLRRLHAQVDLTSPNCPIGVALTNAGLAAQGSAYGVDDVDAVVSEMRIQRAMRERNQAMSERDSLRSALAEAIGIARDVLHGNDYRYQLDYGSMWQRIDAIAKKTRTK